MATEIEYKFLVDEKLLREQVNFDEVNCTFIDQGYLSDNPTVRVRLSANGQVRQGWLTIKGKRAGRSRAEYEYPIKSDDAIEMLDNLCHSRLTKTRYFVTIDGNTWEIDVFEGDNKGLIVAELEVPSEDYKFKNPVWAIKDVSKMKQYTNSNLAKKPFKTWK
jgi:adenylate cyclase